jgi:hypothetical protein
MAGATDYEKQMWALAWELARSGRYANSPQVVMELRSRGFKDTDEILREPVRSEMTQECIAARKALDDAKGT